MADASVAGEAALLPVRHRWLLTAGVMGAQIMQVLDTTIANVALPHMQASLGATVDTISWVLTSYIIATAIALPATGWLSDRIGSRNLFLVAVAGFVGTSMLCGIAGSLAEMVAFRLLQGLFAAFINPLSQTAMMDTTPPRLQARAMSIWVMGVMVGPILGPVLGGWLTDSHSWRWVFYVNVPVGGVTFAILWFLLPTRPRRLRGFDIMGFVLLGLTVAAFQLMLDRGGSKDWFRSWEIRGYALVCAAALWMTVVHLATAARPLLARALFLDRNVMLGLPFMVLVGVSTMAPLALLPPLLQQLFGYPVVDAGLMMAPRGVGVVLSTLVASYLMGRMDSRLVIMAGFALSGVSGYMMSGWTADMDWRPVLVSGMVQGLGLGLVFMPLNSLAFGTLPPARRTDGASLLNLMRSLGQSAGISLATTFLARNLQTSHADLAAHLTQNSFPQLALPLMGSLGVVSDGLVATVDAMVNRQATMIAYIDDFRLLSWLTLLIVPLVLLIRVPKGEIEKVMAE